MDAEKKIFMGIMEGFPGLGLYGKVVQEVNLETGETTPNLDHFPDPENVGHLPPEWIIDTSELDNI